MKSSLSLSFSFSFSLSLIFSLSLSYFLSLISIALFISLYFFSLSWVNTCASVALTSSARCIKKPCSNVLRRRTRVAASKTKASCSAFFPTADGAACTNGCAQFVLLIGRTSMKQFIVSVELPIITANYHYISDDIKLWLLKIKQ